MTKMSPVLYPAKAEFDLFIESLPENGNELSSVISAELAFKAWDLLQNGIPYSDRTNCIYYFYHFLPLYKEAQLGEYASLLQDAAMSSLTNKDVLKYVSLLDSDKLFESCQVRGTLQLIALGLPEFVLDENLSLEWGTIRKESEAFLSTEPAPPVLFIECYMDALQHYCYKTKKHDARLYEIAQQVLEISADIGAIQRASSIINDDENLRAYKRTHLQPGEAKKLLALEALEEQVMSEFGREVRIHGTLGKAVGLLTKEGRERRAAEKQVQSEWVGRIRGTGRSAAPYVTGYAEYLCSWVYIGTDDIKKAIKSLESALQSGFDPGIVLTMLVGYHDTLKNNAEAAHYAQKLLDYTDVESFDEAQDNKFDYNLLLTIKAAGQIPLLPSRIWNSIAASNSQKRSVIIASLESKIQEARKRNIEQRADSGITLIDSLISIDVIDQAQNAGNKFSEVLIDIPRTKLMELSLEEIDIFREEGSDRPPSFLNPNINMQVALGYLDGLLHRRFTNIPVEIKSCIESFPNYMATIPTIKKYIAEFTEASHLEAGQRLVEHGVNKRGLAKVTGFYDAIKPLQKALHQHLLSEEIALICKSRKILEGKEIAEATEDLTEAYLASLALEKSLSKRDRLLKDAESEGLNDERLKRIRTEVNSQLEHRKKIIIRAALVIGAIILLVIIIAILLK